VKKSDEDDGEERSLALAECERARARARARTKTERRTGGGSAGARENSSSTTAGRYPSRWMIEGAISSRSGRKCPFRGQNTPRHRRRRFARARVCTARECVKLVGFTSSVYDRESSRDTRSSDRSRKRGRPIVIAV